MKCLAIALLPALACSSAKQNSPLDGNPRDGSVREDAPPRDGPDLDVGLVDSSAPYRHTITIDGVDDFTANEAIVTTSAPAYTAGVTWDDTMLYVAYTGPDLDQTALDAASKWLFIYVDVDPGATTGAAASVTYNTQHATFPTGFGAEHYARWKCDASFSSLESYDGATWVANPSVTFGHAGNYVELAIPRSVFGNATTIGVTSWMINEKPNFEGSFAGLYPTNFADGYAMTLPLTKYLRVDFMSPRAPSDLAYQAP